VQWIFYDFYLWNEKNGHMSLWVLIALIFKKISFCNRIQWLSTCIIFFFCMS